MALEFIPVEASHKKASHAFLAFLCPKDSHVTDVLPSTHRGSGEIQIDNTLWGMMLNSLGQLDWIEKCLGD